MLSVAMPCCPWGRVPGVVFERVFDRSEPNDKRERRPERVRAVGRDRWERRHELRGRRHAQRPAGRRGADRRDVGAMATNHEGAEREGEGHRGVKEGRGAGEEEGGGGPRWRKSRCWRSAGTGRTGSGAERSTACTAAAPDASTVCNLQHHGQAHAAARQHRGHAWTTRFQRHAWAFLLQRAAGSRGPRPWSWTQSCL